MSQWSVQKLQLHPPPLQELAHIIRSGLADGFETVSVEAVQCPDLRQPPFRLAAPGISGNPRIADIGGPPNLHPFPKWDRRYDLFELARLMEMSERRGFLIGAGAGDWTHVGQNSELMPNLSYHDSQVTNSTYHARIKSDDSATCTKIKEDCTSCGLMANLLGSDGLREEVLKITVSTHTGKLNFTQAIQSALEAAYGERNIGVGGVFLVKEGKVNMHVMPDFSKEALETGEDVQNWLRFFEMQAPLVCLSVFHSHDPGLDLRMEHTHCFSEHGEGGHYHGDTTPESVIYEGYFNVAEALYRIDRPQK